MSDIPIGTPGYEFLLYQSEDGQSRIEAHIAGKTVWLRLQQLADDSPVAKPFVEAIGKVKKLEKVGNAKKGGRDDS